MPLQPSRLFAGFTSAGRSMRRGRLGVAMIEGVASLFMVVMGLLMMWIIFNYIYARTVMNTTAALGAQAALVAYDREAFRVNIPGAPDNSNARLAAQRAADDTLDSVIDQDKLMMMMSLRSSGCAGGPPLSAEVTPVVTSAGTVEMRAEVRGYWNGPIGFRGCLSSSASTVGN